MSGDVGPPTDYRRAVDTFDAVLGDVPDAAWDEPSACTEWSVRDVVAHATWGQYLVAALARGQDYPSRDGAPGSISPGRTICPGDPRATFRAARADVDALLDGETLARPGPPRVVAQRPDFTVGDFLNALVLDFLAHSWDVAHPLGLEVSLPEDLLERTLPVARGLPRAPGALDPMVVVPQEASLPTQWLAALGRSAQ